LCLSISGYGRSRSRERWPFADGGRPCGEPRACRSPTLAREAQIEVAQCTGDRDRADIERTVEILPLQGIETGTYLEQLSIDPALPPQLLRTGSFLISHQHGGVHDAVGKCLTTERRPARGPRGGEDTIAARERVEILADDRRVIERGAIVGDERRDLADRIAGAQRLVRIYRSQRDADQLDCSVEPELVRGDADLAHVG